MKERDSVRKIYDTASGTGAIFITLKIMYVDNAIIFRQCSPSVRVNKLTYLYESKEIV